MPSIDIASFGEEVVGLKTDSAFIGTLTINTNVVIIIFESVLRLELMEERKWNEVMAIDMIDNELFNEGIHSEIEPVQFQRI